MEGELNDSAGHPKHTDALMPLTGDSIVRTVTNIGVEDSLSD